MKKKLLMSVALAALLGSPALAQSTRYQNPAAPGAFAAQPLAGYQTWNGYAPGVIVEGNKYLGQDPDPRVQLQLRRDPVSEY